MKEHLNKAKKFVADHKYEITVGLIVVGAVSALVAVKTLSDNDTEIHTTEVEAIDDASDNGDSTTVEE